MRLEKDGKNEPNSASLIGALFIVKLMMFGKQLMIALSSFSSRFFFLLFRFCNSSVLRLGIFQVKTVANSMFTLFICKNSRVFGIDISKLQDITKRIEHLNSFTINTNQSLFRYPSHALCKVFYTSLCHSSWLCVEDTFCEYFDHFIQFS